MESNCSVKKRKCCYWAVIRYGFELQINQPNKWKKRRTSAVSGCICQSSTWAERVVLKTVFGLTLPFWMSHQQRKQSPSKSLTSLSLLWRTLNVFYLLSSDALQSVMDYPTLIWKMLLPKLSTVVANLLDYPKAWLSPSTCKFWEFFQMPLLLKTLSADIPIQTITAGFFSVLKKYTSLKPVICMLSSI